MSRPRASFTPSGEQVEIRHGDQCAIAVEVGGGLRSYVAAGQELLDGYDEGELCTGGRGQVLIPWPNRLRDGWYEFAGRRNQLALSEPAKHNAIHGLVRWVNWSVAARAPERAVMAHTLHPQAGWPFALDLRIEYALGDEGLTVTTTATNAGPDRCPYGAGNHPYLTLGTDTINPLVLQAPGRTYLSADDQGIPTRALPVLDTRFDFLAPRELGATELDTGYCDLVRDPDGLARVRLSTAGDERRVTLWLDQAYPYLMLFTGDSLPETKRRRHGLGVEPMTCAPNALQSGDGLRVLEPGESLTSRWGISPA
jgi:aldose 1-epimerase